ncbi:MAG: transposase [Saccharofermentanales bacterium]
MPRKGRKKSSSGCYHIIVRGINKQCIFEDDQDKRYYLHKLLVYKEVSECEIYAYCLMSNHVHILLKEGKEDIGVTLKRIGTSYASWYNWKYDRTGHLFQDRYRSEAVETDQYFLAAMRYIHQNPTKAGITSNIKNYMWSSYKEYVSVPVICKTDFALSMFSLNKYEAIMRWQNFVDENTNDECLEHNDGVRLSDNDAVELITSLACIKRPSEIQICEKQERDKLIKDLKKLGVSKNQLVRLTGITYGVIRKI